MPCELDRYGHLRLCGVAFVAPSDHYENFERHWNQTRDVPLICNPNTESKSLGPSKCEDKVYSRELKKWLA